MFVAIGIVNFADRMEIWTYDARDFVGSGFNCFFLLYEC